jgi:hypothetical protein
MRYGRCVGCGGAVVPVEAAGIQDRKVITSRHMALAMPGKSLPSTGFTSTIILLLKKVSAPAIRAQIAGAASLPAPSARPAPFRGVLDF